MTQSYAHNVGKRNYLFIYLNIFIQGVYILAKILFLNLFESFAKRPCHRCFSNDSNSSTVSTSTNSSDTGSDEDNSCDKNDNSLPICDSVNELD